MYQTSVADICNQALGYIGVGDEITDLDTESSKEARACRRFYTQTRDEVLRDFPWPRFMRTVALTLVAEDPNEQWDYSYRMPADVANLIRVMVEDSARQVTSASRIPYEIGQDNTGQLIFCDYEDAILKYTKAETNTEQYPPDMVQAIVLLLASRIAPQFGPDAVKLGDRALKLYEWRRATAQANALNEEHLDQAADAELVRVRDE